MPVSISRTGRTLTVSVTVDVSDIVAAVGIGSQEKRAQGLQRAQAELADAVAVAARTDAELDQQAAEAAARAAALKAARPTGSF